MYEYVHVQRAINIVSIHDLICDMYMYMHIASAHDRRGTSFQARLALRSSWGSHASPSRVRLQLASSPAKSP